MAYTKGYDPWVDKPSTTTPVTAAKLNNIETGIANAHALIGMTLIEDKVLAAATAQIEFAAIPATYKHLRIDWHAQGTISEDVSLRLNGSTSAVYDYRYDTNGGSLEVKGAGFITFGKIPDAAVAGAAGGGTVDILNYANGVWWPMVAAQSSSYSNTTSGPLLIMVAGYRKTVTAISTIQIFPDSGSFAAGSRFSLYGLM